MVGRIFRWSFCGETHYVDGFRRTAYQYRRRSYSPGGSPVLSARCMRAQVVHRDLKPENIMVVYDDSEEGRRCIVLDSGIAQIPDGACDLELSDPHAEDHHALALSSRLGTLDICPKSGGG